MLIPQWLSEMTTIDNTTDHVVFAAMHSCLSGPHKKTTYSVISRDCKAFPGFSQVCHAPSYASSKFAKHLCPHEGRIKVRSEAHP